MAWQDFLKLQWRSLKFQCCALKRYVKSVCHSYKYIHNTLLSSLSFLPLQIFFGQPSPTTNMGLFKVFSVCLCRISHPMQNVSLIWKRFLLVKDSKFLSILGTHGYCSVRVLLRMWHVTSVHHGYSRFCDTYACRDRCKRK